MLQYPKLKIKIYHKKGVLNYVIVFPVHTGGVILGTPLITPQPALQVIFYMKNNHFIIRHKSNHIFHRKDIIFMTKKKPNTHYRARKLAKTRARKQAKKLARPLARQMAHQLAVPLAQKKAHEITQRIFHPHHQDKLN